MPKLKAYFTLFFYAFICVEIALEAFCFDFTFSVICLDKVWGRSPCLHLAALCVVEGR